MPTDWGDALLFDIGGAFDSAAALAGWAEHEALLGLADAAVPQLASASTTSIAAGDAEMRREVEITGNTGISSFGAATDGMVRTLRFVSAGCVVNHSSAITCPGAAAITSEAGTVLEAWKLATADDWIVVRVDHPSALVSVGPALSPGFLFGLTLSNNTSDATNDIDIATGKARDGADGANLVLASGLTKRLDANWTAGTNQGGLDTGSKANSTTYHVWLISDGTTVDVLFSTSASAPTMPGGYTIKRRIGSIITDSSGVIRPFKQAGDEFLLVTPPAVTASVSTTRLSQALTVPAGLVVDALIRVTCSAGVAAVVQPLIEADASVSATATPLFSANDVGAATLAVRTDTSRQIGIKATGAGAAYVITRGWIDRRGRDA